jgi:hypothetical protein
VLVSTLRLPAKPVIHVVISGRRPSGLRGSPRYAERVFRRRPAAEPQPAEQEPESPEAPERPGVTQSKGRPTPKRSEAERRRRQPYAAPSDSKAAYQQSKDRDRASRARRMEAMKRGESWALPRKDQGPVRALARDYVDSRRGISEYYMFGVLILIVLLFIPTLRKSAILDYLVLVLLLVIVVESYFVGTRIVRLARQRFPGESTRGIRMYAAIRATQIRRLRMPAPRVKVGDKI